MATIGSDTASATAAPVSLPRTVEQLELLGRYEDSGYEEPPFLVRRADDGQVVQLPEALYRIVEALAQPDAQPDAVAAAVSEAIGRRVEIEDVRVLIDEKLAPLGLIEGARPDGGDPRAAADPMLLLRAKVKVVPAGAVRAVTTLFRPFFFTPVIVAALAGLVAFDIWFFGTHGVAQPMRDVLYQPGYVLVLLGLIVASAAFHEIGHATGCAAGGGTPGVMGAGVYVVWPVFYTDVTDAYRLGRAGRLRTDLGGVYFNVLFILGIAGLYAITGVEALLAFVVIMHLEIVHQFLPFLRLDGYYVVADITGVPDLFARIGPILRSVLPWKRTDESVRQLKPWVRVVVTTWVLTVVPLLGYLFVVMLLAMPRLLGTAWDAMGEQWSSMQGSFADGDSLAGLSGIVGMLALSLPLIALPLTLVRTVKTTTVAIWRRTAERPGRRALYLGIETALLAALAIAWWPTRPGDPYRPITAVERGVITEPLASVATFTTEGLDDEATLPIVPSFPAREPESLDAQDPEPLATSSSEPATEPETDPESEPSPTEEPEPSPSATSEPTPSTSPEPSTSTTP